MFLGVFIKFGEKEHLLQLQNEGLIYCNTFEYFEKCENSEQYDQNENATSISQGNNCNFIVNGYEINAESGLINVILKSKKLNHKKFTHLFSMFCRLQNDTFESYNQTFFDNRLKKFGEYMLVIYNPFEFMKRLKYTLDKLSETKKIEYAETKRIEYIDFNTYNGEIEAFRKSDKYKHQSEWRLAIQNQNYNKPFKFNIGSIQDISTLMPTNKCKNIITKNKDGKNIIEF